ncbi:predicted protein [Naegleria gruberi]|uniref:Predicted protein n=1 Tax=Naegleria gruberi TaxID=5762 RepID=D2V0V2_NAEGR|nr:uncharacterized protein NAEGRDRAFT_62426 [Naegleria gruberi]EFC49794.1 predicted protein [Naegleria gruberi]|eukprot:XP_002682538.1 predicted protein [Naegleria gruberi strain NEG-M]
MLRRFILSSSLGSHHRYNLIVAGGIAAIVASSSNRGLNSGHGVVAEILRVSENRSYHTSLCLHQNSEDVIQQVLRDPETSDSIKDFVLETVNIVERRNRKKKISKSEDLENVEYLEAVKKYQKDITQKEPLVMNNTEEAIDNVFRKYLKSSKSAKLSKILSFFVKYPDVARTGEFYSRFLRAIGENLQISKKMPIETIDKIFEKIQTIDITPDTYRALILCYANKGKMDAIPGLLDKMDALMKKGFISTALSENEVKQNKDENTEKTKQGQVITDSESELERQRRQQLRDEKEKKYLEYLKLRCTFESFVHNMDLTAVERLIVMKRNEWIANHKYNRTYLRMLCDSLEFYLFNQKYRQAKQLINLVYKYELPRTRGKISSTIPLDEDSLLSMSDKPTSLDDTDRFFNLLLRFYKDSNRKYLCTQSKRMSVYKQHGVKVDEKTHPINEPYDLPREVLSTNRLFELTIAEMKREGVPFTKNIYKTLSSYYYRQQNYERCIFFFEDCLRHGIIPSKTSFIYAEESYLITGDVKKAMQCHQMRDLHYRISEISPSIQNMGASAILDYLYNFENQKASKGSEKKRKSGFFSEYAQKKEQDDDEDLMSEFIPKDQKKNFKKKQVYSLTDLYLKLSDAAKNQEN